MNAGQYHTQGLYQFLTAELLSAGKINRLLDVGCGLGHGLAALTASITDDKRLIVGIDENPECLIAAATLLGLDTAHPALRRTKPELRSDGYYETRIAPTRLELDGNLLLINVDLMIGDLPFDIWLDEVGPFDAVTMWFSGVHKARSATMVARNLDAKSDADLREALEDQVIKLAVRCVRPGGVVQIAYRAAGDADELRRSAELRMPHILANHPFKLARVLTHAYQEPTSKGAVKVKSVTQDLVGRQSFALSMLLRGRELSTRSATDGLFKLANRTPFNIAPERAQKLATEVFGTDDWTIRASETEANFYAVVEDKAVYLSYAGLASLWCVARVAYDVMDMSSRAARRSDALKYESIDLGAAWAERNLGTYIEYARHLISTDEFWPLSLEVPNPTAAADTPQGRINNLFFGALSWIILHEIGHVHYGHEKIAISSQSVRQEHEADGFATSWILDEAGQGVAREFRVLMVVTALAWLFMFEEVQGQGSTHPPVILRFREAVDKFGLGDRSVALENASYLLKALFDPASTGMEARPTPREAFDWISARLEDLFPIR
jgi:SAM-dependent methyltransferase